MARIARVVMPHFPHHITQRGNRRQETFFCDEDYQDYIKLLSEWCAKNLVEIWAYCLMPNHVHLIAVPGSEESLRLAIGETHRRYTRKINFRKGWKGHLWQGRFASFPMDNSYLLAAVRYVELNPIRAGMVSKPEDYRWSSAAAHLSGNDDGLVKVSPLLEIVKNWRSFIEEPINGQEIKAMRHHERTGRPFGNENFILRIENYLNRILKKLKPGPKTRKFTS